VVATRSPIKAAEGWRVGEHDRRATGDGATRVR
jgi:hypothetical protein